MASLLPVQLSAMYQDGEAGTASSGATAPVTAPPATLPPSTVADEKEPNQSTKPDSEEKKSTGVYFSIGDSSDFEAAKAQAPTQTRTARAPLVRLAKPSQPSDTSQGLIQQAHPAGVHEASTNDAPHGSATGIGNRAIVAPVASIQGLVGEAADISSVDSTTRRSVDNSPASDQLDNTHKSFLNPNRFRVDNGVNSPAVSTPIAQQLAETNEMKHEAGSVTEAGFAANAARFEEGQSLTEDLNAVVQHVVNNTPTYRLPPVEKIPSSAPSFAMQTSAHLDANARNDSIMNPVAKPVSSERRGFRAQDEDQDRAPGEPDLKSISESENPLSRLGYPTNANDYGDEVPEDEYSKRFSEFAEGALVQNSVRESVSYGKPSMWYMTVGMWEAPGLAHRPLYFEEVNLERYGHYVPRYQPAISAAHFVASLASLPYQMYVHPPCEPIYTLGHYRPGSCNPHQIHYLPVGR